MTAQQVTRPQLISEQKCPVCDQAIPSEKAAEARGRLAALHRRSAAEAAQRFSHEKDELTRCHAEAMAKLRADVATQIAGARADERKLGEVAAQARIAAIQKVSAEREATWQQRLDVATRAGEDTNQKYEALKADFENGVTRRVQEVREALDTDYLEKSRAKDAAHAAEKQKLTDKVAALGRQLEKKTAEELGEGAEVKLYDVLRHEFPDDRIERVGRGNPGADILHTVIHNGRKCGQIIYDSKNAQAWRNDYITKLVQDQTAAKADCAVLCVLKFPFQSKQLDVRDGVIVVNPARAVAIVQLLRKQLIEVSNLRLSKNERAKKMGAIYDFIMSKRCSQLLSRFDSHAGSLLKMQEAEVRSHQEAWRKQGLLIRSIQKVKGELEAEIDRIIGTGDDADLAS